MNEPTVPRDHALERRLSALAAQAAGLTIPGPEGKPVGHTFGLDEYADHRAFPGGVRTGLDADRETCEELADARNYLLWGLVPLVERFERGDVEAGEQYARRLRALSHVVRAWHALHGG